LDGDSWGRITARRRHEHELRGVCTKTELGVNRAESLLFKTLCISLLQNRFNSSRSHYLGPITVQSSDASMERVFSEGIAGTSRNGTSLLTAFSL